MISTMTNFINHYLPRFVIKWIKLLKDVVLHCLDYIYYYSQLVFKRRFVAKIITGRGVNSDQILSLFYLGKGHDEAYLKSLLFSDIESEEHVGNYPFICLPFLRRLGRGKCAVTVYDCPIHLTWIFKSKGCFVIPSRVEHQIDLTGEWQDVVARFRKNTRKTDLRKIRKYAYQYSLTQDVDEIQHFYDYMHKPYLQQRFGDTVIFADRDYLIEIAKHNALLKIELDGVTVSAAVLYYDDNWLEWLWIGLSDTAISDLNKGASSALYYYSIMHAHEKKYPLIKLQDSRPFLNDGIYRYKRKWGGHLVKWSDNDNNLVAIFDFNLPAVRNWLSENPFLSEIDGGFVANVFRSDSNENDSILKDISKWIIPGISEVRVYVEQITSTPEDVSVSGVPVKYYVLGSQY